MIKTQIQLPDELYRQLKRVAADKEWSLAETLRRGAEILLASHPQGTSIPESEWTLEPPANTELLADPFANPNWREEANLGSGAMSIVTGELAKR